MKTAFRSLLHLFNHLSGRRDTAGRRKAACRSRLRVEALEDRSLPSVSQVPLGPAPMLNTPIQARGAQPSPVIELDHVAFARPKEKRQTNLDRRYTRLLAGRKWQNVSDATSPFVAGTLRTITEIVFQRGGTFTANSRGDINGFSYYSGSAGRWQVRNNGILELRYTSVYPTEYCALTCTPIYWPEREMMLIRFINNGRFRVVSRGNAIWIRIPLHVSQV